jgi:hypothetical protein
LNSRFFRSSRIPTQKRVLPSQTNRTFETPPNRCDPNWARAAVKSGTTMFLGIAPYGTLPTDHHLPNRPGIPDPVTSMTPAACRFRPKTRPSDCGYRRARNSESPYRGTHTETGVQLLPTEIRLDTGVSSIDRVAPAGVPRAGTPIGVAEPEACHPFRGLPPWRHSRIFAVSLLGVTPRAPGDVAVSGEPSKRRSTATAEPQSLRNDSPEEAPFLNLWAVSPQ